MLAHPFELRRRVAFAREALTAGRVPDPAPDPAAAMHPLTLRFANGGLERAYATRTFTESYPSAIAFCITFTTLLGVLRVVVPETRVVAACCAAVFFVCGCARVWLHRAVDQSLAASRFAWGWGIVWAFAWGGIWDAHRRYRYGVVSGVSANEWLCGPVAMNLLFALFMRFIALPASTRFIVLVACSVAHLSFTTPVSEFGQPVEGLLLVAVHLVAELLGHPFELQRRVAFASRADATRRCVPDAAPDPATAVHPLTLRFSNGGLERAYATRTFTESYPIVAASCLSITALSWLVAIAYPQLRPTATNITVILSVNFCARAWLHCAATPWYLALAAAGVTHLTISPARSEFGQPVEGLLAIAALLVGDLLGHPFELRSRVAFAREALAAGRVPDAAPDPTIAVHPLTLRFSNGALESAYAARSFSESWPILVASCLGFAALFGMLTVAVPRTRALAACHAHVFLTLLCVGGRLRANEDQARAQTRFASIWSVLWTLAIATFTLAHRRFALVSGLNTAEFATLLFVYLVGASYQRFLGLPAARRLMAVAAFCLAHLMMTPSISELGQPHEALLVAAVAALSELLGHTFELHRRLAFAREALAAGRVPDADAAAAVMRLVHPLTLRFSNGALESAYAARAFSESYPIAAVFCLSLSALCLLLAVAAPGLGITATVTAFVTLAGLGLRALLHRAADQASAALRFAWAWCGLWTLFVAGLRIAQWRFVLIRGVSTSAFLCGPVATGALGALFLRFNGLPATPRFLVLVAISCFHITVAPISELGQPLEGLLVVAALLVGDLLGHPFELRSRVTFAHEALAAGRVPDPDAAAAVHPLTLRFADGGLERAYSGRSFSESYSTLVNACASFIVLVGLLAVAVPPLLPISATVAAGCVTLICVRMRFLGMVDQAQAGTWFACCFNGVWALASLALIVVQRHYVLVPGISSLGYLCVAALQGFAMLCVRFTAQPAMMRVLTFVTTVASVALWTPAFSDLGHPHETLVTAAAMVVGELLGHPFELQWRVAFAREALTAGRVPDPAPDPTAAVHPLTLRFANGALESAYGARCYEERAPIVVAFCMLAPVLMGLLALAIPAFLPITLVTASAYVAILSVHLWLRRAADKKRAHARFAAAWCAAWVLAWGGLAVAQRQLVHVSGLSTHAFLGVGALSALTALFQRCFALAAVPRLVTLAAFVGGVALWSPAFSELGQPHEALLVAAALVVGELIGHQLELHRRLAYVQVYKHETEIAETEAKARTLEERLRRCFSICHDQMMQFDRSSGVVRITRASNSFLSVFGHRPESVLGDPRELTHLFRAEDMPELMSRLLGGGIWEQVMLHADGHEVMFEHKVSTAVASHDEDVADEDNMVILISRDITDRVERQRLEVANAVLRAEAEMHAEERRHSMALEAIADVVLDVRLTEWTIAAARDCRLADANSAAFEALFGAPVRHERGYWPSLCVDSDNKLVKMLAAHEPLARAELVFVWPHDTSQVRTVDVSVVYEPSCCTCSSEGEHAMLVVCHDLSDFHQRLLLEKDRELLSTQIKLERVRWDLALRHHQIDTEARRSTVSERSSELRF